MDPYDYLQKRQIFWALRHGIPVDGQHFVLHLINNLFVPLSMGAQQNYGQGAGQETDGKMRAVHSGAAMIVNVFDYWRHLGCFNEIATACGLNGPTIQIGSLEFEVRRPVQGIVGMPPHLDVEIRYTEAGPQNEAAPGLKLLAIEAKFSEPYRDAPGIVQQQYLDAPLWDGLGPLHDLANQLAPGQQGPFVYLNAAQLIKHILGLRSANGFIGFQLLYLWNAVPGHEAVQHQAEISKFVSITDQCGIRFRAMTFQELIHHLGVNSRTAHRAYIDYLTERYY